MPQGCMLLLVQRKALDPDGLLYRREGRRRKTTCCLEGDTSDVRRRATFTVTNSAGAWDTASISFAVSQLKIEICIL